ncbi:MAG: HNH endonuclease signature motif containing protein [Jatrophihabitans sp.]
MFARDRGCTFPDCTAPAARSQIHHATDWAHGGHTNLDNLAIACGYHNNEAPRQGWQTVMIHGVPHWLPPAWRDPQRGPLRNHHHHPELVLRR